MKHSIAQTLIVAMLSGSLGFNGLAGSLPGEVDLGQFFPTPKAVRPAELTLKRGLIGLVALFVEDQDPYAAGLLHSLRLVRMNVVPLTDQNRGDVEQRAREVLRRLEQLGWKQITTGSENNDDDVHIYVKAHGDGSLEGLVVTVRDHRKQQTVCLNLVGNIQPEELATIGRVLDLNPLSQAARSIRNGPSDDS